MESDAWGDSASDADEEKWSSSDGPPSEVLGLFTWLLQVRRQGARTASSRAGAWDAGLAVRSFGRFQLEGLLGAGSYGAVFRAFDPELGCAVALKIAWPAILLDPGTSRRFCEEPKAVAGLTHLGIVRVYDSGRVEMARYISFELIEGPTLAEWTAANDLMSGRLAAEIIRTVAEAIHVAHGLGIVHRDLKPSNILLRPIGRDSAGGNGFGYRPVVTDFGLARRGERTVASDETATQAFLGTDRYMSPEQASGQAKEAGPASDVFSLGVILYELVAGMRPFDGDNSDHVRSQIQEHDPPAVRSWRKQVSRDLETIIFKCLEKKPAARYDSAGALADDLQRYLTHQPIRAKRTPLWRRTWKFTRRRPLVVTVCAAGLLVSLAITWMLGAFATERRASNERIALVQEAAEAAERAATRAEELERQHQYATSMRNAARAYQLGNSQETQHHLRDARSLAHGNVRTGLEWELLTQAIKSEHRVLPANPGSVRALRFSPDGKLLISGGSTMQLTFWDTETWESTRTIFNKGMGIKAAEFSPDGAYLAVAGEIGWVVVHRLADMSVAFEQRIFKSPVHSLAWMDGALAVGGRDAVLAIIDLESGDVRRSAVLETSAAARNRHPSAPKEISTITYIPSRRLLAVVKSPPEVLLVEPSTLSTVDVWFDPTVFPLVSLSCHLPLGPHYLALAGGNQFSLHSIADGSVVAKVPTPQYFASIQYSESTRLLVCGFRDGSVQTWSAEDLAAGIDPPRHQCLTAHQGMAICSDISPDGRWLISGGKDRTLRLWENPLAGCSTESPMTNETVSVRFSPCGRWMALAERTAAGDGIVSLHDVASGRKLWATSQLEPARSVYSIAARVTQQIASFDRTGDSLVICEESDRINVRESTSGKVLRSFEIPETAGKVVSFAPDGKSLIIGRTPRLQVIDAADGRSLPTRDRGFHLGAFATAVGELWVDFGSRLLSPHIDSPRYIRLQHGMNAEPFRTVGATPDRLQIATLTHDGARLAAADHGTSIYVWDLTSDRPADRLIADDQVEEIVFADNGQTLISGLGSKSIVFWHLPTKSEVLSIGSSEEQIVCMGLHPSETMMALGVKRGDQYALRVYRFGDEGQRLAARFEMDDPSPNSNDAAEE